MNAWACKMAPGFHVEREKEIDRERDRERARERERENEVEKQQAWVETEGRLGDGETKTKPSTD